MLFGIIQTASLLKLQRVRSLPVFLDQGLVVHVIVSDLIWVPLLRAMVAGWFLSGKERCFQCSGLASAMAGGANS